MPSPRMTHHTGRWAGFTALLAVMWAAEAQQPQPPVGTQIYSISPTGTPLLWHQRATIEGDFTGDGLPDRREAWNVTEFQGAGEEVPRPDLSGVWSIPSETITDPSGAITQMPGERQGPFPDGWVDHFVPGEALGEWSVVMDDGFTHALGWPGVPESQLPIVHENLQPLPLGFGSRFIQWTITGGHDGPVTAEVTTDSGYYWSTTVPESVATCGSDLDPTYQYRICGVAATMWLAPTNRHGDPVSGPGFRIQVTPGMAFWVAWTSGNGGP